MFKRFIFTAIFTTLFAFSAFGQNQNLSGKVIDQSGAVISGATVKVRDASGKTKTTVTGSDGEFVFSDLAAGTYRLTVEKTGFESFSEDVSSGQSNLSFVLNIAGIGATVEVTGETYAAEDSTTAAKINVPSRDIPQSVQVVNQNLLRDRATFSFGEAVTQNVSGITKHTTDLTGAGAGDFLRFRGFAGFYNNSYLRDGFKFPNYVAETADVERIEVLKGTSSVLYGRSEPGGGQGTLDMMKDKESLAFLNEKAKTAKYITSVCTGSLILGAAGLLKGHKATSHWATRDVLKEFGALPTEARIVEDRKIITGGGVTAGIDFGLTLAAKLRNPTYAEAVQLYLEYDPQPPFNSGSPKTASKEVNTYIGGMLDLLAEQARKIAKEINKS